jgi:drug/metabolite transporter (DMT)-like permease
VLLDQAGPAWIAAMRALVAAAVLAPVWFSAGARLGVRGHLIAALSGSCNVGLFFGLQAAGIDHLAPGVAAACVFTQPVFVLVLGHCVLGERIGVVAAVAATMVVLGVWLASAGGRTASAEGGAGGSLHAQKEKHTSAEQDASPSASASRHGRAVLVALRDLSALRGLSGLAEMAA